VAAPTGIKSESGGEIMMSVFDRDFYAEYEYQQKRYSELDDYESSLEAADEAFDMWYEGNSFETDWGYAHGQY